ncbi:MAG: hypothetical protein ACOYU7_05035 [Bacillota bacterium]|nr:MAG: hypothetical protein KatS3mg007_0136 [Thermoanaerobaculum sp.]
MFLLRSNSLSAPLRCISRLGLFGLLGLGLFALSCKREGPVGDGWLSDKGLGSYYPRRRITLPAITVNPQPQERVYRLRGLPKEFYTVWLVPVVRRPEPGQSSIGPREYCQRTGLSADVVVSRLTVPRTFRAHGRFLESCEKREPDGFEEGDYTAEDWVIVGGTLRSIMLRGDVEICVRVWVEQFDPSLPRAEIRIVLVGGGFKI